MNVVEWPRSHRFLTKTMETTVYPSELSALLEQSRSGDTAAFARLVQQHQSVISGLLFSSTGDFHKSEDLAQETFLIAWNKLGELKNDADFLAWLCTIARNLAHRSFRKKSVNMNHETLNEKIESPSQQPVNKLLKSGEKSLREVQ